MLTRFDLYAGGADRWRRSAPSAPAATGSGRCCSGSRSRRRSTRRCCCRCSSRGRWRREGRAAALSALALQRRSRRCSSTSRSRSLAPQGVVRSVWRQLGRPLQIESLGSASCSRSTTRSGCRSAGRRARARRTYGHAWPRVASALTTSPALAALVLVWVRFARGDTASAARFVRYAAAAVVAFVAFGKVALAAVPDLAARDRGARPGPPGLAAIGAARSSRCALTRVWFPSDYWDLVKQFDPTASWLVLAPRPRARRRLRRRWSCGAAAGSGPGSSQRR